MMPRSLRPLVLLLIVATVLLLRFLPQLDPFAGIITDLLDQPSDGSSDSNPEIVAKNDQIARLEHELRFVGNEKSDIRAYILNKTNASFRESIKIAAGSDHGVKQDQPVLSGDVLIGLVDSVEPKSSIVLLIGDPDIKIPVVIGESEGIVTPQAGGVVVDQVAGQLDKGSIVKTSGLGGLYPPGLLVGELGEEIDRAIFGKYQIFRNFSLAEIEFVTVRIGQ